MTARLRHILTSSPLRLPTEMLMILGQMLIRLRHHGCVLMPHQHGKTHRVHIVLQSLGRE